MRDRKEKNSKVMGEKIIREKITLKVIREKKKVRGKRKKQQIDVRENNAKDERWE